MSKITAARVVLPKGFSDMTSAHVMVTIDGQEEKLFDFYHDEIRFRPDEFIGLSREQGWDLKRQKDRAYLRS